ncbi:MAG: ATP-binding protein [Myxococcales bacterium]|nr:ATP-binding protein [Myxococcales bacterium]
MSPAAVLTPPPAAMRRVVIVEDEGILALDIERQLSRLGFDVRGVAGDCEAALVLIEREKPDLVLMDIRIQGPLDGIETVLKLRERFDVAIVYLTAHSDPNSIERAQQTLPMGYLLKPFKKADLQNVVTIALARDGIERQLRRREELLRTTLSCIGEALITTDEDGAVTSLNAAATTLLGPQPRSSEPRHLREVLPLKRPDGATFGVDPVQAAQASGRVDFEARLDTPEGQRSVVGTAAAVRAGLASYGVVLAVRDLTELLLTRRQLEFSERLSAMGTMAAGVAHEVNNPLAIVMTNLSFALREPLSDELREALVEASDGAQRVARIVRDLTLFAKPQPEALTAMDPRRLLTSALALTRGTWRSVCGVDLSLGPVPTVMASPMRLSQVVVNLVINAVHAMQGSSRAALLTLSSHTNERGDAVMSVLDTGPGVPAALHERIFEPFFTTKSTSQGTGLGLAVSRSIVESHGARLTLDSTDAGARFSITLPAAPRPTPTVVPTVCWIGPATDELRRLGVAAVPAEADAVRAELAARPNVVLLALPPDEARRLASSVPELEDHFILVTSHPPPRGVVRLVPPFDLMALAALVR